jgi:hypothetical protein
MRTPTSRPRAGARRTRSARTSGCAGGGRVEGRPAAASRRRGEKALGCLSQPSTQLPDWRLPSTPPPRPRQAVGIRPQLVVVSTLTRAIETAVGAFGDHAAAAEAGPDGTSGGGGGGGGGGSSGGGLLMAEVTAAEGMRAAHPAVALGGAPPFLCLELCREHLGVRRGWRAGARGRDEGLQERALAPPRRARPPLRPRRPPNLPLAPSPRSTPATGGCRSAASARRSPASTFPRWRARRTRCGSRTGGRLRRRSRRGVSRRRRAAGRERRGSRGIAAGRGTAPHPVSARAVAEPHPAARHRAALFALLLSQAGPSWSSSWHGRSGRCVCVLAPPCGAASPRGRPPVAAFARPAQPLLCGHSRLALL